jgi:hypothetical protein
MKYMEITDLKWWGVIVHHVMIGHINVVWVLQPTWHGMVPGRRGYILLMASKVAIVSSGQDLERDIYIDTWHFGKEKR